MIENNIFLVYNTIKVGYLSNSVDELLKVLIHYFFIYKGSIKTNKK